MPVKNCKRFGNKYFCFNEETKTVSVFTEQIYQLNECPDYVLAALIGKKEDVQIVTALSDEEIKHILAMVNNKPQG